MDFKIWYRVYFKDDKTVLNLDYGDISITMNIVAIPELFTLIGLILWHVKYI